MQTNSEELHYKFVTYVPPSHLEALKIALAEAGAGKTGNYDNCMWTTPGQGQFRPLDGSNPFIGTMGQIERVEEIKIETTCSKNNIKQVIDALRKTHPYETPAFQYWPVFFE